MLEASSKLLDGTRERERKKKRERKDRDRGAAEGIARLGRLKSTRVKKMDKEAK